jgi:hypothetical protein
VQTLGIERERERERERGRGECAAKTIIIFSLLPQKIEGGRAVPGALIITITIKASIISLSPEWWSSYEIKGSGCFEGLCGTWEATGCCGWVANFRVRDFGVGLGERGTYIVKPKRRRFGFTIYIYTLIISITYYY